MIISVTRANAETVDRLISDRYRTRVQNGPMCMSGREKNGRVAVGTLLLETIRAGCCTQGNHVISANSMPA